MRFLGAEAQYFFPGAEKWRRNFENQFPLSRGISLLICICIEENAYRIWDSNLLIRAVQSAGGTIHSE